MALQDICPTGVCFAVKPKALNNCIRWAQPAFHIGGVMMVKDFSEKELNKYLAQYGLDTVFTEDLLPFLVLRRFSVGEYLCNAGEQIDYCDIVVSGKCRVEPSSEGGKIVLLDYVEPLSMVGDIELVCSGNAMHSVIVTEELVVISIHKTHFKKKMMNSLAFTQFLMLQFATKIKHSSQNYSRSMLYPLRTRLGHVLLNLQAEGDGELIVIKQTEVAQILGVTERHLRRVLSAFEKEEIITRCGGNGVIIINKEKLLENSSYM